MLESAPGFISLKIDGVHKIVCKIELPPLQSAIELLFFEQFINGDLDVINTSQEIAAYLFMYEHNKMHPFLAGVAIKLQKNSEVIATLRILKSEPPISAFELKMRKHKKAQLTSLLQLHNTN